MCISHHIFHNIITDTVFDVWILPHIFIDFPPFVFWIFIRHIPYWNNHSSFYPSELLWLSILLLDKFTGYLTRFCYRKTSVIVVHTVTFPIHFIGDFCKICWYHCCHTIIIVHTHNHWIVKTYIFINFALLAWIFDIFPDSPQLIDNLIFTFVGYMWTDYPFITFWNNFKFDSKKSCIVLTQVCDSRFLITCLQM